MVRGLSWLLKSRSKPELAISKGVASDSPMLEALLGRLEKKSSRSKQEQTESPMSLYIQGIEEYERRWPSGSQENIEKARGYFAKVLSINPTDADAWAMYGHTSWFGNPAEALHAFSVEASLRTSRAVYSDISYLLEHMGRVEESFKVAEKVVNVYGGEESAWLRLRELAAKLGKEDVKQQAESQIKAMHPLDGEEIIRRGYYGRTYDGPHYERDYSKHHTIYWAITAKTASERQKIIARLENEGTERRLRQQAA